jgi:hypothetical protein
MFLFLPYQSNILNNIEVNHIQSIDYKTHSINLRNLILKLKLGTYGHACFRHLPLTAKECLTRSRVLCLSIYLLLSIEYLYLIL